MHFEPNRLTSTVRTATVGLLAMAWPMAALAIDNTLLIQMDGQGQFKVWHIDGATNLPDPELQALELVARPEGSPPQQTSAGPATAFETEDGIAIVFAEAKTDKTLLVDRDACGGVKVWHADGATQLSDEQLTDIFVSAVPGGGKRVVVGNLVAKAFATKRGVIASVWKPVVRSAAAKKF